MPWLESGGFKSNAVAYVKAQKISRTAFNKYLRTEIVAELCSKYGLSVPDATALVDEHMMDAERLAAVNSNLIGAAKKRARRRG